MEVHFRKEDFHVCLYDGGHSEGVRGRWISVTLEQASLIRDEIDKILKDLENT